MRGRRVTSLKALDALANSGRSVWVSLWRRHSPASWVISMQARVVARFMDAGIYEYKPQRGKA